MIDQFLTKWASAATTSLGFFWMALWAFILGYAVSGFIQVFVTTERMQKTMGSASLRSVALGTLFGFASSSCSFSALATTKTLFQKGASLVASVAFLLASTNLVIELGIVISIFLGWQFVAGEYVGGLLLILVSLVLIRAVRPRRLVNEARENMGPADQGHSHGTSFWKGLGKAENWSRVGHRFAMEWQMVWKDVTFGFTVAGIISAFVPDSFFQLLFVGTGSSDGSYGFWTVLQHVVVAPLAAFATFIGSMGNIPLAALLFTKEVSFGGIMAFIFSDLVVFPVLRINARYYGWRMALFLLGLLLVALVVTSLALHYGLMATFGLPDPAHIDIVGRSHFQIDYTFWLNLGFLALAAVLVYVGVVKGGHSGHHHPMAPKSKALERAMTVLALASYVWLALGLGVKWLIL